MTFTNAELVRHEAGDPGTFYRDLLSGDGSTLSWYLTARPVAADSQVVLVGGAVRTEVASAPGATEYTLDDDTGLIAFGAAPAAGVDNVSVAYTVYRVPQAAIDEACRLHGLTAGDVADVGPATAALNAAAMVCEWMASETAGDFDYDADGQSYKRGTTSARWAARAAALRDRLRRAGGLVSVPVTRLDGYARRGEYSTRDLGSMAEANPRRQFYGEPDRLP